MTLTNNETLSANQAVLEPADTTQPGYRKALFALGMGGFAIGTGEFVIMGLLPDAAKGLGISIPDAGHLISVYALGVVIGAPLLAVLGARLPRRNFLMLLMALFSLGNLVSSYAPTFYTMAMARFMAGFPHGAFFGVAALVAASLVERHRRTQAVSMVLLGLTIATLLGVPIVAGIGQWFGWRSAFAIVGGLGVVTMLLVYLWVPYQPGDKSASPLRELSAFKRKQVLLTLGIGAIGSGGLFSVFSYVKPTMLELAHLPESMIPVVLALFGVGMITGNLVGAKLGDKAMEQTIRRVLIWAAIIMGLFVITAHNPWFGPVNVMLVGTVVALSAVLQTRLMDVAGDAQTLAAAMNHSAFNIANALGAWLGGVTISAGLGWQSTGWVGALLAIAGLGIHWWAMADMRSKRY